ncbi:MAG: inositol monophosphatase [Patescibacteria group bacterium]
MIDITPILQAAQAGGKVLKGYFGKNLEITEKTTVGDFRTQADLDSEKVVLEILGQAFPEFNLHGEESGLQDKGSEYTFFVDPLDGSNNFVLGIPYFSCSIGLAKGDQGIVGVVYNPIAEQLFSAQAGQGAKLNGQPIQVSKEQNPERCSVALACGYETPVEFQNKLFNQLHEDLKRVLTNWGVALDFCLLASGTIEGLVFKDLEVYDFVAGKVIAQEAGAKLTGFDGSAALDFRQAACVASNGSPIHQKILDMLHIKAG